MPEFPRQSGGRSGLRPVRARVAAPLTPPEAGPQSRIVRQPQTQPRYQQQNFGVNQGHGQGQIQVPARNLPVQNLDAQQSIANFFRELRRALGVSPHQAAAHLLTHADVIEALETGNVWHLPAWPETARIVMAYTAAARVDGQPVLAIIADILRQGAPQAAVPPAGSRRAPMQASSERLRRAGSAFKEGAKRLPAHALHEARQRPVKALYTLSLPIGAVILLLNTSLLQSAVSHLPGAFVHVLEGARGKMTAYWAPVRDGHRWIETDDPRQRRADRLEAKKIQDAKLQDGER
jgi:hypothetical protein